MEKKREEEARQRAEEEELAAQAGGISLAEARDRKRKSMEVCVRLIVCSMCGVGGARVD